MSPGARRLIRWAVVATLVLVAGRALLRFPWRDSGAALASMAPHLVIAALFINLISIVAKGWGWQILLQPSAKVKVLPAVKATLVGCAVTSVSTGVVGEAARAHALSRDTGAAMTPTVAAIVAMRAVEAVGAALFLALAPLFVPLPATLRTLQLIALALLAFAFIALQVPRWQRLPARLPAPLRNGWAMLADMGALRRLPGPLLLVLVNWAAQWATFYLVLKAADPTITAGASIAAIVATNIMGLVALTPGNVGIFQAAIAVAVLPFGVPAEQSVAAGVAIQAIQVLPVLAIATALVGVGGLRQIRMSSAKREA